MSLPYKVLYGAQAIKVRNSWWWWEDYPGMMGQGLSQGNKMSLTGLAECLKSHLMFLTVPCVSFYAHPLSRCFCCTKWENKSNHPIQLGPPWEPRCRIEGWNSWGKGPCLSLFYYYRTKTKGDYFKGILQLIEEVILHGK